MGLIVNTPTTIEMVAKVNNLFNSANIGWWRQSPQKNWFKGTTTKKKLHEIARAINLAPDAGFTSTGGGNWIAWLTHLHTGNAPTPGDQIEACISDGLDDNPDTHEIYFVVIPTSSADITVTCSKVGPTKLVSIYTPTVEAIKRSIRRRAKTRVKNKKKS